MICCLSHMWKYIFSNIVIYWLQNDLPDCMIYEAIQDIWNIFKKKLNWKPMIASQFYNIKYYEYV